MDQLDFLALIAQLTMSIQHRFEIKTEEEVFFLKIQKNVYKIMEDYGKFINGVNMINRNCIALQCRNRASL